jgi:hypothetical protein
VAKVTTPPELDAACVAIFKGASRFWLAADPRSPKFGGSANFVPGSRFSPTARAIAYKILKAKERLLSPQVNCARHALRAENGLSFISRIRFVGNCRRVVSRAVAGELMGECQL